MRQILSLLLGLLFTFAFLMPSFADDAPLDFVFFNTIPMKDIENVARKYPNEINIKRYYSTAKFITDAGINSAEGKGWVFLINLGKTTSIALSDNAHHAIIYLASTNNQEYNLDIDNLLTSLVRSIDECLLQAMQKSKTFSILEVRNANRDSVAIDIYNLSDSNGKISLKDNDSRNGLITAWSTHSPEFTSNQEKSSEKTNTEKHILSDSDLEELDELWRAMDTNGNGKLDLEEIFDSK